MSVPLIHSFSSQGSLSPLPTETRSQEGIWWICSWCAIGGRNLRWWVGNWHTLNTAWVDLSDHLKSLTGSQTLVSGLLGFQGKMPKDSAVCAGKLGLWEKKALICSFCCVWWHNYFHNGWFQAADVKVLNMKLKRDVYDWLFRTTMSQFLTLFGYLSSVNFAFFVLFCFCSSLILLEIR